MLCSFFISLSKVFSHHVRLSSTGTLERLISGTTGTLDRLNSGTTGTLELLHSCYKLSRGSAKLEPSRDFWFCLLSQGRQLVLKFINPSKWKRHYSKMWLNVQIRWSSGVRQVAEPIPGISAPCKSLVSVVVVTWLFCNAL